MNPANPSADQRPEFKVAVFGLATRFRRLLEIVLRHAHHNRYRYSIATTRSPGQFDLALIDMTASGAPKLFDKLTKVVDRGTVVRVGRRNDPSRQQDDLLIQSFVAQVLFTLNRVVDRQLSRKRELDAAASARPGLVVSDFGMLRRPRVLVVDDSPTVRRQLGTALHQMGIDCEAVSCAGEALEQLEMRRYELVLADVVMPDMDGYRMTRLIKKNRSLRGMPVVILTSRSSPFDLARGALAGCNSYLVKPVTLQSLRETLNRHLSRAVRRDGGGSPVPA
jgi:CheY-like chemotaxis protein